MSNDRISFVYVVNSIDQLSETLKQKVISNTFSLSDLVDISKPKIPKRDFRIAMAARIAGKPNVDFDHFSLGWNLTDIEGFGPSKLKIVNKIARTELEKRKKIIDERAEFAEDRKKKAFMKVNHQPLFDRMSMNQKEKAWIQGNVDFYGFHLHGICNLCYVELPIAPNNNIKCERYDSLQKDLDAGLTGQIRGGARSDRLHREQQQGWYKMSRDKEISFISYTNDISFYWILFPNLRIIMACDSCADKGELLEKFVK